MNSGIILNHDLGDVDDDQAAEIMSSELGKPIVSPRATREALDLNCRADTSSIAGRVAEDANSVVGYEDDGA